MSAAAESDAAVLARLDALASSETGGSASAIAREGLLRAPGGPAELLARARARDPQALAALREAATVGETYFFRQPDHFRFLADRLVPELTRAGRARLSAWSAGCATGEEAWSLAATLRTAAPADCVVAVLGTDLIERRLRAARAAIYRPWSLRPDGPLLYPLLDPSSDAFITDTRITDTAITDTAITDAALTEPPITILPALRPLVRFQAHDLRDPAPAGPFDVVLCRNVLVYLSAEAARLALQNLAAAVAPGGALVLGALDEAHALPSFERIGPAELQIFRRRSPARVRPALAARPPLPPRPRAQGAGSVEQHRRALELLERGRCDDAGALLEAALREDPAYVPGLLELALAHLRAGRRADAEALMREVVRLCASFDPERVLPAPEPLPARFFDATARAFLAAQGTR
jgi:chemotaxis methyl-accepting protein methylase